MIFPRFFLKAKEEGEILLGSPWVYDNEILFGYIDVERRGASPDYSQFIGYDRGEYLKCVVFRVL